MMAPIDVRTQGGARMPDPDVATGRRRMWGAAVALSGACLVGASAHGVTTSADDATSPFVVVLGVAQDGGRPQAGCAKPCCTTAWTDAAARRRVACLGIVDPTSGGRWLVDATPDFTAQLRSLDALQPP